MPKQTRPVRDERTGVTAASFESSLGTASAIR